uniref:Uncharacterized protein n=1 Tax=Romanomermis culicivorax TaxID=13658 RepID=A0A915KFV6_ROMCU
MYSPASKNTMLVDKTVSVNFEGKDITPDEATVMVIDRAKMQNHHSNGHCGGEFYNDVFYKNNNFPPSPEKTGLFNKVLRRLSEPFRRLKGAFNVSAEDILFIDDERLLNFWRENYAVTPT